MLTVQLSILQTAWEGWSRPVAGSCDDGGVFLRIFQFDLDLMKAGMGIRGLEAQQIAVVEVVIELVHPKIEFLTGFE